MAADFAGTCSELSKELRRLINSCRRDLRDLLESLTYTRDSWRERCFKDSRKNFYSNFLRGLSKSGFSNLSRVTDVENGDKVVDDPTEVKKILVREASKLLCQGKESRPNPPAWYRDLYAHNAKNLDTEIWTPLTQSFTSSEVIDALSSSPNTAPGEDGIIKSLLLTCLETSSRFQRYFLQLLETWRESGLCPEACSLGQIKLVPKPGKFSSHKYTDKRPLTMLSEIAKLPMKIMADRLQQILFENPQVLEGAQTGFLKGGGIEGPVRFVLDRIADAKSHKEKNLFILAFDFSKAFDKVQFFSIDAMMKRFGFPEIFRNFVMNYLKSARSCILTRYGPTEAFNLENSVRQGDPLSPLLYILVIDGLHCRLSELISEGLGVSWNALESLLRCVAKGYADDVIGLASTPMGAHKIFEIVREFSYWHFSKLNASKTVAVPVCDKKTREFLLSLDWGVGNDRVDWEKYNVADPFRYLGVQLRADLSPESHFEMLEGNKLNFYLHRLKKYNFTAPQTVRTINEVFYPTLDFGGSFLCMPNKFRDKWSGKLCRALQSTLDLCSSRICYSGLMTVCGLLLYKNHAYMSQISDRLVFLNSFQNDTNLSARKRVLKGGKRRPVLSLSCLKPRRPYSILGAGACGKIDVRVSRNESYTGELFCIKESTDDIQLDLGSAEFSENFTRFRDYLDNPDEIKSRIYAATDGSFWNDRGGWATVFYSPDLDDIFWIRGGGSTDEFRGFGENYGFELMALAVCLQIVRTGDLRVYTDCKSFIDAFPGRASATLREKIRTTCRPIWRVIDRFSRDGVLIRHVKAHKTRCTDPVTILNDLADVHANAGRLGEGNFMSLDAVDLPFLLSISKKSVVGDYRKCLKPHLFDMQIQSWRESSLGRNIEKMTDSEVKKFLDSYGINIRATNWFVDCVLNNLPTHRILDVWSDVIPGSCGLCGAAVPDNCNHFLTCPCFFGMNRDILTSFRLQLRGARFAYTREILTYANSVIHFALETLKSLPFGLQSTRSNLLGAYFFYLMTGDRSEFDGGSYGRSVDRLRGFFTNSRLPGELSDDGALKILRESGGSCCFVINRFSDLPEHCTGWSRFCECKPSEVCQEFGEFRWSDGLDGRTTCFLTLVHFGGKIFHEIVTQVNKAKFFTSVTLCLDFVFAEEDLKLSDVPTLKLVSCIKYKSLFVVQYSNLKPGKENKVRLEKFSFDVRGNFRFLRENPTCLLFPHLDTSGILSAIPTGYFTNNPDLLEFWRFTRALQPTGFLMGAIPKSVIEFYTKFGVSKRDLFCACRSLGCRLISRVYRVRSGFYRAVRRLEKGKNTKKQIKIRKNKNENKKQGPRKKRTKSRKRKSRIRKS